MPSDGRRMPNVDGWLLSSIASFFFWRGLNLMRSPLSLHTFSGEVAFLSPFFRWFLIRSHSLRVSYQVRYSFWRGFYFCPFSRFLLCVFVFLAFRNSSVRCLWDYIVFLAFSFFFLDNKLTRWLRVDLAAYGLFPQQNPPF